MSLVTVNAGTQLQHGKRDRLHFANGGAMDEFANRDAQGLTPRKHDDETAISKAKALYWPMLFGQVPVIGSLLATVTYLVLYYAVGYKQTLDTKFAFMQAYDLGYVYLAIYMIVLARFRLTLNANVTPVTNPREHEEDMATGSRCTRKPNSLAPPSVYPRTARLAEARSCSEPSCFLRPRA